MKRVADYIVERLAKHGISNVFIVTGGAAMHLNDAFGRKVEDMVLVIILFHLMVFFHRSWLKVNLKSLAKKSLSKLIRSILLIKVVSMQRHMSKDGRNFLPGCFFFQNI